MKNQSLTPRERLGEWAGQNKNNLGQTFVEEAAEIAELCYLAFFVFEEGDKLETDYPRQAVISETKFGSRPSHRPPTSQPVAYAAYFLEQQYGTARDVIHEFIEALTVRTFEQSELRKLMKPIRQRLTEAAKATGDRILGRLTAETFIQEQTAEVEPYARILTRQLIPIWSAICARYLSTALPSFPESSPVNLTGFRL